MADWDDEDFELKEPAGGASAARTDKWEGEDEDDDIKEEWDAESDEENKEKKSEDAPSVGKAVQKKKKKKLHEIIAEKEEARAKELETKRLAEEDEAKLNTPEGKLAEKLRLQKLAEDGDLELAREMAGMADSGGLNFNPTSKEEFDELRTALVQKLEVLESKDNYQDFACSLINSLCMNLTVTSLKKVKGDTEGFISAKLKEERAQKSKKAKPAKATIKMETDRSMFARGIDDFNDMDDFM